MNLSDEFNGYMAKVGLADCPSEQRRMMKEAFFAGASISFFTIRTLAANRTEEEAMLHLDNLEHELLAFAKFCDPKKTS